MFSSSLSLSAGSSLHSSQLDCKELVFVFSDKQRKCCFTRTMLAIRMVLGRKVGLLAVPVLQYPEQCLSCDFHASPRIFMERITLH